MTVAPGRVRTPQAVRRERTRARVLDAAIECLAELGYAKTTTTEIARRAGVSRGAQLHHFPTKAELVAAAVERTFDQRAAQVLAAIADAPAGVDRMQRAIDVMWAMYQGPACDAWVELVIAARSDDELRPHAEAVNRRHQAMVDELFEMMLTEADRNNPFTPVATKFLFALFDGLVVQRMGGYDDGPGRAEAVVEAAKALTVLAFGPRADPPRQ